MSEYQYYEFQAFDTPLTRAQMDELRRFSTRARITPTTFMNEYHWGGFKGDPNRWIEKYFDAFVYVANWGTRWIMFRLPGEAARSVSSEFKVDDAITIRVAGSDTILSFHFHDENGNWYEVEGEGWLSTLAPLRAELLAGDYRCLYLGWLAALELGQVDETDIEPPVPPGLGALSETLESFADFFHIGKDLIAAAAERSPELIPRALSGDIIAKWVATLPEREKAAIITTLVDGTDRNLANRLRQRAFDEMLGVPANENGTAPRRSVAELLARAEVLEAARKKREEQLRAKAKAKREREEAERREKYLQTLVGKEETLWAKIDQLVKLTQPKPYDEALETLLDLRDLAEKTGTQVAFAKRASALYAANTKRPAFAARIRKVGLA